MSILRQASVADLYIKELKGYKAPPTAKDAHVGTVKAYALPPTPKPPVIPTDLAAELSAYDATEPTKADAPKVAVAGTEHVGQSADSFLESLEADLPKADSHH
ncbi:hypothetical protein EUX98_g6737 [Antrodiella citrinella]|uniref:ATP synthase subunit H, mitochondrial n=1 Tax=Antrodiella citrinella TaxID=2447956 RepID=A0A4S4MVR4_9APHY|nr:hypothetical protein EUX98_g6737 [Antrodiella citrinella]